MLPALLTNGSVTTTPTNRLSTLFDRFFNDDSLFGLMAVPAWSALPGSVWEDEHNVYVEIEAPGMTDKDVDISIQEGNLIVRGERKSEQKEAGYDTRTYGRFEQRMTLPCPVDADGVEAKLTNGVFSLTCPKSESAKPRKIAIKGGE